MQKGTLPKITPGLHFQKGAKWIAYLRTENLKNHTLFRCTYLYSLYVGETSPHPSPPREANALNVANSTMLNSVEC